jgi:hypothetical protein
MLKVPLKPGEGTCEAIVASPKRVCGGVGYVMLIWDCTPRLSLILCKECYDDSEETEL